MEFYIEVKTYTKAKVSLKTLNSSDNQYNNIIYIDDGDDDGILYFIICSI